MASSRRKTDHQLARVSQARREVSRNRPVTGTPTTPYIEESKGGDRSWARMVSSRRRHLGGSVGISATPLVLLAITWWMDGQVRPRRKWTLCHLSCPAVSLSGFWTIVELEDSPNEYLGSLIVGRSTAYACDSFGSRSAMTKFGKLAMPSVQALISPSRPGKSGI